MDISGSVNLDSLLDGCEIGVEKQLVLTVVPKTNGKSGFTADVVGLEHYDDDEPSSDESEPSKPTAPSSKPKRGDARMIIAVALGKPKKSASKDY